MTCEMEQMYYETARRYIQKFWEDEYSSDSKVPENDTDINLAYSTIEDSSGREHEWQASADLERRSIVHEIDGKFVSEDRYHDLEGFVEDVIGYLEWDWLYRDGCTIVEVFEAQGKFEEV